jgi:hypothetical protein
MSTHISHVEAKLGIDYYSIQVSRLERDYNSSARERKFAFATSPGIAQEVIETARDLVTLHAESKVAWLYIACLLHPPQYT